MNRTQVLGLTLLLIIGLACLVPGEAQASQASLRLFVTDCRNVVLGSTPVTFTYMRNNQPLGVPSTLTTSPLGYVTYLPQENIQPGDGIRVAVSPLGHQPYVVDFVSTERDDFWAWKPGIDPAHPECDSDPCCTEIMPSIGDPLWHVRYH